MCGRFTLIEPSYEDLAETLSVTFDSSQAAAYRPRYNIAPTDPHWVMHMESGVRELIRASWGLVPWWSKSRNDARRPINARSETIKRSPVFREAFERRRCVVVADGFYEWTPPPEGMKAPKQPIWFRPANGGLLLMAGLWESWQDPASGERSRSFTIVTRGANSDMDGVHDRMPVVIKPEDLPTWLGVPQKGDEKPVDAEVIELLGPAKEGALSRVKVSTRVNSVKNDDPLCIASPEDVPWVPPEKKPRAPKKQPSAALPLFADNRVSVKRHHS